MTDPQTPQSAPANSARGHFHWRRYLILLVLAAMFLLSAYTWLVVHWNYSNGYRSGMLQKFSDKGWLCKTHEGELWQSVVPNVAPSIWWFTVRDQGVARQLDTLVGRNIRLHYTEHRGIPTSCFGDTRYFVDSVAAIGP